MKRNGQLLALLIFLIGLSYLLIERPAKEQAIEKKFARDFFSQWADLDDLSEIKLAKLLLRKNLETSPSPSSSNSSKIIWKIVEQGDDHQFQVSLEKLQIFFSKIGELNVVRLFDFQEQKKLAEKFEGDLFPPGAPYLALKNKKKVNELVVITIGKKVSYEETFYARIQKYEENTVDKTTGKNEENKLKLIQEQILLADLFSKEQRIEFKGEVPGSTVYQELLNILQIEKEFFIEKNFFRQLNEQKNYKEGEEQIRIKKISSQGLWNRPFDLEFTYPANQKGKWEKFQTHPQCFWNGKYDEYHASLFLQDLANLRFQKIYTHSSKIPEELGNTLALIREFKILSTTSETLTVSLWRGGHNMAYYYVTTDSGPYSGVYFQLASQEEKVFLRPVQYFWDVRRLQFTFEDHGGDGDHHRIEIQYPKELKFKITLNNLRMEMREYFFLGEINEKGVLHTFKENKEMGVARKSKNYDLTQAELLRWKNLMDKLFLADDEVIETIQDEKEWTKENRGELKWLGEIEVQFETTPKVQKFKIGVVLTSGKKVRGIDPLCLKESGSDLIYFTKKISYEDLL